MTRKLLWAVLAIDVALIAAPFVMGLPDKAAGGEKMIDAFAPIMDETNVETTSDFYYTVFVPLGEVVPAMSQENIDKFNRYLAGFDSLAADAQNMGPQLAAVTGMPEADVQQYIGTTFPAMSSMLQGLPTMQQDFNGLLGLMGQNVAVFNQVPAGLDHYEPLVTTMEEQQANYDKIAGLPDFRRFSWFFVIPGLALVGLAATGLFIGRDEESVFTESMIDLRAETETETREKVATS